MAKDGEKCLRQREVYVPGTTEKTKSAQGRTKGNGALSPVPCPAVSLPLLHRVLNVSVHGSHVTPSSVSASCDFYVCAVLLNHPAKTAVVDFSDICFPL